MDILKLPPVASLTDFSMKSIAKITSEVMMGYLA